MLQVSIDRRFKYRVKWIDGSLPTDTTELFSTNVEYKKQRRMRFALEDYANSLPEYTADKLSYKIVKVDSWIKTLQDAIDHAVKIDQESR